MPTILKGQTDEVFKSDKPAIIYGAGRQAGIVYSFCKMYAKKCAAIMTSGSRSRWSSIPENIPLVMIDDIENKKDYDVIVAIGDGGFEVSGQLEEAGYEHIFYADNWRIVNEDIRASYYEEYFEKHNTQIIKDDGGNTYIKFNDKGIDLKMYYPVDETYRSAMLGEINNIVLPAIYNDYSNVSLGPYELPGEVELSKGDNVLDLGANIGLFSCVAAAKGCNVYAVEPNKHGPSDYLRLNCRLNSGITVIEKAIGAVCDITSFFYNQKLDENLDICRGSVHGDKEPDYEECKVPRVTVDKLVEELNLERVDFIKSHTEDEEISMLLGARDTIAKHKPKIAMFRAGEINGEISSEIQRIIQDICPDYKIEYKWRRIFCYCDF